FTKTPLPWNAYTFLDRFLIDGGTALTLVLVALTGGLAGYFWTRARLGSVAGVLIYAIGVSALVAAYRQNLLQVVFFASLVGVALLALAKLLARFRDVVERRPAHIVR